MTAPRTTRDRSVSLPETATALSGNEYCPKSDYWLFATAETTCTLDFARLRPYCDENLIVALKLTLVSLLRIGSVGTARKYLINFTVGFVEACATPGSPLTQMTETDFLNRKKAITTAQITSLVALFRRWNKLRLPGIEPALVSRLRTTVIKNDPKGRIVLSDDPDQAAFTELELQAVLAALTDSFTEKVTKPFDFLLVMLLMMLGTRGVQLAALKIKDFKVVSVDGASPVYMLFLPRAKQRGQTIRTQAKKKGIHDKIGVLLRWWISIVKQQYREVVGGDLPEDELPIFPCMGEQARIFLLQGRSKKHRKAPGFAYHTTGSAITRRVDRIFARLPIISPRTGKPLNVNARRFRHTLATRAAQQGLGLKVIAEWLDHSSLDTAWVYVDATPKLMKQIAKAVTPGQARYAAMFKGEVIPDESEAPRFNGAATRVSGKGKCWGNCAKFGFCNAYAPIGCYVCKKFRPWLDAPHVEIYQMLERRRKEYMDTDPTNALGTTLDGVMAAVLQCIEQCAEMKEREAKS